GTGPRQGQLDVVQAGDRQPDAGVLAVPLDHVAEELDGRGPDRGRVVDPPGADVPGGVDGEVVKLHGWSPGAGCQSSRAGAAMGGTGGPVVTPRRWSNGNDAAAARDEPRARGRGGILRTAAAGREPSPLRGWYRGDARRPVRDSCRAVGDLRRGCPG